MLTNLPPPSEDALRGALDCLPIGVGVFDPALRLMYANRPFAELRGLPAAVCRPGAELSTILHHIGLTDGLEAGDVDAEVALRLAELPGMGVREVEQTTSTGLRLLIRLTPVSGGGLMLTYSDVTEARRIERALRENEERYARVTEAVAEGIYDWNIERDELYVSPRLIEIFGFHGIALTASDWNARVHADDRAAYSAALRECFQQRTRVLGCEYRVRLGNGEYRWVEDHGLPVRNERQRAVRLVGAVSDVTDRKLMEQALRESEQRHALAMEAINEGVYEWDLRSGEMYYSPRLRTVLGLSPEQLTTREDWIKRIHPDDLPPYRAAVASHLKGESERLETDYRYQHPDGTWHWARQHGVALRDASGRATRMTGSTGDITGEKEFEIQNKRLFDEVQARTEELSAALEQQTATSEVLKVISRSTFDLQKVLDTLVESAAVLCGADIGALRRREGDVYKVAATFGFAPEARARIEGHSPLPSRSSIFGQAVLENRTVHIPDILADPDYARPDVQRLTGFRSALGVLLRREGNVIGTLVLQRFAPGPFTPQQIELVETFANQAVIAIENTRLFEEVQARTRDLTESLEYQTATSDVLNVISRSPTDTQPVFDAIAQSAARLCDARFCNVFRFDGELLHLAASHGLSQEAVEATRSVYPMAPGRGRASARSILSGAIEHIPDIHADADFAQGRTGTIGNYRSVVAVPMLKDGRPIGTISVMRSQTGHFPDRQVALLRTFADQAVIAIQNARLFEEVQARTREVTEALERQTATAKVLGVISSSKFEIQPVLDAIVETAGQLCRADAGNIWKFAGGGFQQAASYRTDAVFDEFLMRNPAAVTRGTAAGRAVIERRAVHIVDALADPEYDFPGAQDVGGFRTLLGVPLLRDGEPIGAIILIRSAVEPFTDKQIELVTTFADQAVIAIQNARLFEEVQARTREVTEALAYQTATSEVLNVISRSPKELQPVLDAMLKTAARLCEAEHALLFRLEEDGKYHMAGANNATAAFVKHASEHPLAADRGSLVGRTALERRTVHLPDCLADPEYTKLDWQHVAQHRTILGVPLLRDSQPIGVIALMRNSVKPFTDRQIELVTTFADQAVIAINNVGLFEEVQVRTRELTEALEYQTATSEVLSVISRSKFDLQPVLDTLVQSAARLCQADCGFIWKLKDNLFELAAVNEIDAEFAKFAFEHPPALDRSTTAGRSVLEKRTIHIPDVQDDADYSWHGGKGQTIGRYRTVLGVPLLREGEPFGAFALLRSTARPFADKEIELVTTFADQAVIAIENVRLFDEVQARTRELTESLEQQIATSEILGVIGNSLTDTQPVFEAIVRSGLKLFPDAAVSIAVPDGELVRAVAVAEPDAARAEAWRRRFPFPLTPEYMHSAAILDRRVVDIPDVRDAPPAFAAGGRNFLESGYRAVTIVPMMRGDVAIGALSVVRVAPGSLSEKQRAILQTFADQAVIAIENVRLFDEVQARTREVTEALEYQTATSEVLNVISQSPTDTQPVFNAIAQSTARLCQAEFCHVYRFDGEFIHYMASHAQSPEVSDALRRAYPMAPGRGSCVARAILSGGVEQVPDVEADPDYAQANVAVVMKIRSIVAVPMLKDGRPIGAIALARAATGYFPQRQIDLLQTFADQAVIAIQNVRLFDEVQARTDDLSEALRQQTATADVLKVISRSTFDLQTVLRTLLESAVHLCEADQGTITRQREGKFYRAENHGFSAEFRAAVSELPVEPDRGSAIGRALLEGRVIHIPDVLADPDYTFTEALKLGDFRAILGVPMMKEGVAIGVLAFMRREPRPFTEKQIELVSTFADQAAIAIENVRLFESVEARTRELARSLEELRFAQDRLVQTDKLASLGQLTAGIAHEIKNPLNFVNNFSAVSIELIDDLRTALEGTRLDDKTRAEVAELTEMLQGNLERVVQHGKRADSIVKNMLLHSRESSGERRPADINAIVEESLNLAYHGARAERQGFNITLERSFDPAAGEVDLFPQEITRVLLNLISNGFYAATKRGTEAKGASYQPTLAAATRSLGDSVEIRIRDNGTGIPPEVKDRMFNPFFTTKPAGEGTGLGLSLSHDIVVKQHAGTIEVDTLLGEFTEFRIVLPRGAATIAKSGERA